jgi:succinate dehydrogenase/fumarate reductase cytochrome b subunit
MNMDLLLKGLSGVAKVASWYKKLRNAYSTIWGKLIVYGIFVCILAYFFG